MKDEYLDGLYYRENIILKRLNLADEHVENDRGSVIEEGRVGEEEKHKVLIVKFAHALVEPMQDIKKP